MCNRAFRARSWRRFSAPAPLSSWPRFRVESSGRSPMSLTTLRAMQQGARGHTGSCWLISVNCFSACSYSKECIRATPRSKARSANRARRKSGTRPCRVARRFIMMMAPPFAAVERECGNEADKRCRNKAAGGRTISREAWWASLKYRPLSLVEFCHFHHCDLIAVGDSCMAAVFSLARIT